MTTAGEERGLADYLAILRRRWALALLVVVLTIGAAGGITFTRPKVYRSSMKIVVGQGEGIFLPEVGNVAEQFTQTMSNLLRSDVVANRVTGDLGLNITPDRLLGNLSVVTQPESAVLEVRYDSTDASEGRQILAQVGQVFTQLVDERLAGTPRVNGSTAVSATIFDPAHVLPDPVEPQPVRNLAVALVLGVLLGVVAAFVREALDDRIRSAGEAERAFGQAAAATLPPGLVGYRPLHRDHGIKVDPVMAELAFERLRASVLWTTQPGQIKSLLITSAEPDEGKSTLASNLAVILANQGSNVVIVEADLRRPALGRYLGAWPKEGVEGVHSVLSGRIRPLDALVDVPLVKADPGLNGRGSAGEADTFRAGRLRALVTSVDRAWPASRLWPAEFTVSRTSDLVAELAKEADYVIVDAPPILSVTDTYQFVGATDSLLAVVRNQKSSGSNAAEMSRMLQRLEARRVQLVVTECEPQTSLGYYAYRRETSPPERPRLRTQR